MATQQSYGNFVVTSFVADDANMEISTIAGGKSARHAVQVENWSTIPYDVSVEVELPQGMQLLSFDGPSDGWTAKIWALAQDETERDECVVTAAQNGAGNERVYCCGIKWKKAGRHRWTSARNNLPLSLSVTVT